ncbi:putative AsnC family transcriptional regulator [Streptomyces sp. Tu6071]|uniref:Lrp/AsnC family transcriptional regulator n=1 Tax=Streptomyces evansiae TaxID=3075535 RepID=A0ABD5EDE6_9ACTN|nr:MULTISPECIES: Lrp/AsnC family transcriptional regulator [unclassified Streptomyces]EGJ75972.1 putative AsnC family transcriptional regulator [Streptomyces sp. Tu6071]MDT0419419.1 Lrp/AsnC family transcriptional regulator [Streptomyces sp. DSM 41982]
MTRRERTDDSRPGEQGRAAGHARPHHEAAPQAEARPREAPAPPRLRPPAPRTAPGGTAGTGATTPPAERASASPAAARPREPRPLDAVDHDILRILQADGRASIRSVAEQVHVSRANAYARINRLVEDGVILGFGARVHHERAGQGASAYLTLRIVQNSWRTVHRQLRGLPGVAHIALVSGDFDVLVLVHSPDNRALRELVLTRLQAIPEILSTRTLLVFEEEEVGQSPESSAAPEHPADHPAR